MANPCIANTDCIDLDVNPETGNLEASLQIDPDAENCLECTASGLNLPLDSCLTCGPSGLTIVVADNEPDSGCLECTDDGLALILNASVGNSLGCTPSGLFSQVHRTTLLTDSNATVPAGSKNGNAVQQGLFGPYILWTNLVASYGVGNVVHLTGWASISYTNTSTAREEFAGFWGMGNPSFLMRNGWQANIGCENNITSPHLSGTNAPSVGVDSSQDPFTSQTRYGQTFPPQVCSVESYLDPGESVTFRARSYAIVSDNGASGTTPNSEGAQYFGCTVQLYVWTS